MTEEPTALDDEEKAGAATLPGAVASRGTDLWLAGGLSILAMAPFVLLPFWSWSDLTSMIDLKPQLVALSWLINFPHFIITYRLFYGQKQARDHRVAGMATPVVLVLAVVVATVVAPWNRWVTYGLAFLSQAYLAIHYTGQTWGVMSTFGHLEGVRFNEGDRRWLRGTLRVMLVWHVVWLCDGRSSLPDWVAAPFAYLYDGATLLLAIAVVVGLVRFGMLARRTGNARSVFRVWVPWLANVVWYVLLFVDPVAIFFVQIAHALQYLSFPLRVESNRQIAAGRIERSSSTKFMFAYFLMLVPVSLFVIKGVAVAGSAALQALVEAPAGAAMATGFMMAFGAAINIHHYVLDGVAWKISNPEVRRELLAHVGPDR